MRYIGIIPSRFHSSRFPGKPLCKIGDKCMIEHVYTQVHKAKRLEKVIVATDHNEIAQCVQSFGGNVCMTASTHQSGTERCAEVFDKLASEYSETDTVIINIQGDEPFIQPEQIEEIITCMEEQKTGIGTLVLPIRNPEDLNNPNVVKVVLNETGKALYFSRSPIPYLRSSSFGQTPFYKHIGMYAYRADVLKQIVKLPVSTLESAESLEQLRWLSFGYSIATFVTKHPNNIAIDTPADLEKANIYYHQLYSKK